MRRGQWRHWRPDGWNKSMSGQTVLAEDIFLRVSSRLQKIRFNRRKWRKTQDFTELNALIDGARGHAIGLEKQHAFRFELAAAWLYALVLQAPRAAVAQEAMDEHPHGYHNKEHRLYELIDFNDAFDSAVIALPQELLPHFAARAKVLMDEMCQKVGTRCFSNEQYHAIVHGLSREIAVYLGVKKEGFEAELTNRRDDAFGIDMRILDPKTMKSVNVDIKTRSSYFYRIKELEREGRLSEEGFLMADRNGFTAVMNGHGSEQRQVVTWRIDHAVLGDVVDFQFADTKLLAETLRVIMLRYGEK